MPSSSSETRAPAAAVSLRRELGAASLVALFVVAAVLGRAIFHARTHTLGAWDWLAQASSLTSSEPGVKPQNVEILDPVQQMVPWAVIAREQIAAGQAPLWNPHNAAGLPLIANFQSALLSPFTLPFYVLPVGAAILVSAALKLFALAFGMFLFLRELRLSRFAAAFSSIAFATAGFQQMCLLHPHVGVLACLPPALIAIERAARRFGEGTQRLPRGPLAALALVLGAMVLAGHPETLLFCLYTVAAFALLRIATVAHATDARAAARFGGGLLLAGIAGGLIGAAQIAPFVAYLPETGLWQAMGRHIARLPLSHALLHFFPDAAGSPVVGGSVHGMLAANYQEVNSLDLGGLITLLALAAPLVLRREALGWFFFGLGLAALACVFDVPVVTAIASKLFLADNLPATRVNPLWFVSACVLAGITIERLFVARDPRMRGRALALLALATLAIIGARSALDGWWQSAAELAKGDVEALKPALVERANAMVALALLGVALLAYLRFARGSVTTALAWALLLGVVASENVYVFGRFMPLVEDRFVLPQTPDMTQFQAATEGERVVFLTSDMLHVNTNACYGIGLVTAYDPLELQPAATLREDLFGVAGQFTGTPIATRRGLELFGIAWVVTRGDWLPLDTEACSGSLETQSRWYLMGEYGTPLHPRFATLDAEHPRLSRRIRASRDRLSAVVLLFHDTPAAQYARVALELREEGASEPIARRSLALSELRAVPGARLECLLRFDEQPHSAGREYELSLALDAGSPAVEVFRTLRYVASKAGDAESTQDDAAEDKGARTRIVQDIEYGHADFAAPVTIGQLVLHRYTASPGRAWIVTRSIAARDADQARELVLAPGFDPKIEVVLADRPPREHVDGHFELARSSETASSAEYNANCSAPAFLVLSQSYSRGWRARVNGREAPLLRANYAFTALELPQGEAQIELTYAPSSFRYGAWTSLAALLAVLLVGWRALARAHTSAATAVGP